MFVVCSSLVPFGSAFPFLQQCTWHLRRSSAYQAAITVAFTKSYCDNLHIVRFTIESVQWSIFKYIGLYSQEYNLVSEFFYHHCPLNFLCFIVLITISSCSLRENILLSLKKICFGDNSQSTRCSSRRPGFGSCHSHDDLTIICN